MRWPVCGCCPPSGFLSLLSLFRPPPMWGPRALRPVSPVDRCRTPPPPSFEPVGPRAATVRRDPRRMTAAAGPSFHEKVSVRQGQRGGRLRRSPYRRPSIRTRVGSYPGARCNLGSVPPGAAISGSTSRVWMILAVARTGRFGTSVRNTVTFARSSLDSRLPFSSLVASG